MPHREGLRRPRHLHLGLWLTLSLATTAARAQLEAPPDDEKPVFLVADVVVGEGVPLEKDAARDVLATRFGRLKDKLEVRSLSEAKANIDAVAMQQLMGSGDDADLAKIESYLQVDRLVIGRVTQVGGVIDVQVKVFNTKEGVTEVAFARRLGHDADRSLILTLLDTLADSLLAWTIEHYTDGSMSKEATAMAHKKLTGLKKPEAVADAPPWSGLGVTGGVLAGLGTGVATLGGYVLTRPVDPDDAPFGFGLAAGGAAVAVAGVALVVIDVANGPPGE
jgi:hypothetical protein